MKKYNTDIFDRLHDSGIAQISFDYEKQKVRMVFTLWDAEAQREIRLSLSMYGVSSYTSHHEPNTDFMVVGCHSAQCTRLPNGLYEATFLLDFKTQAVAWKLTLVFERMYVRVGGAG